MASAVQAVAQGDSLISPSMASKLLREFSSLAELAGEKAAVQGTAQPAGEGRDRTGRLRPPADRPRARGAQTGGAWSSNREIADQLYISENTVKNHMRNILEKLHLHSRVEAVVYTVRQRLLDPHHPDR